MLAQRALLAIQPKLEFTPESRPVFDELMEKTPPVEGVTYEAATVGGVFGWWCRPALAADGCAVLYFHGGAYILGSAAAFRNFVGQIADRAKSSIFIVEYALAPERAFPSALHDAEAVYRSFADAGLSKLAIAGDSAGGGLALALLLAICNSSREDSVVKPVAAAAMSPWLIWRSRVRASTRQPGQTRSLPNRRLRRRLKSTLAVLIVVTLEPPQFMVISRLSRQSSSTSARTKFFSTILNELHTKSRLLAA
jgi:acetyl esterase/lipase